MADPIKGIIDPKKDVIAAFATFFRVSEAKYCTKF